MEMEPNSPKFNKTSRHMHGWFPRLPVFAGIAILLLFLGWVYQREESAIQRHLLTREAARVETQARLFRRELSAVIDQLLLLADGDSLRFFLQSGDEADLENATQRAVFVSRQQPNFDQIRMLNEHGREVMRVNRGGQVVAPEELQEKSSRPYFAKTITFKPHEIHLSALDLNVEKRRIETPFKPVIRFAVPLFNEQGQRRGVYVINYLSSDLLSRLQQIEPDAAHRMRLLNAQGHWLKSDNAEQEWGFLLPNRKHLTMARTDPGAWQKMVEQTQGQRTLANGSVISWRQIDLQGISVPSRKVHADDPFLVIGSEVSAAEQNALFAGIRTVSLILFFSLLVAAAVVMRLLHLRQQSAEALRKSQEFLAITLQSIGDAVLATNIEGHVTWMNPVAEQLTGWTEGDAVGQPVDEVFRIIHEITRKPAVVPVNDALKTGKPQSLANHTMLITRDGREISITDSAAPIRDKNENIIGAVLVFRDMTAERDAYAERDRIFDLSMDILCVSGADGYFKRINPAFCETLGWTEHDLLTRPFVEFVHPDDLTSTLREVERQVVEGKSVLDFENRYLHRNGSWRILAWRSVPQPGGLMYATARDVTDARLAEAALRRSQQSLAITLRSIGDAVMATDAQRRITRMNPVAETLTGWTQAEAEGRPIEEIFCIISEETRLPAIIPVDDVLATGAVHGLANHTALIARDGTERSIADSAAPIRDDAGNITGVVLVFREVADERRFERELKRLNQDLERRVKERTAALAEIEQFNRATLDALSAHVAVLDETGTIVATNRAWTEFALMNHISREQVGEGANYLTICDRAAAEGDADAAAAAQAIRQVSVGEMDNWVHEYPCHSPDEQRWFYCRVTRFPGDGPSHVVIAHENITPMKVAQEQLAIAHVRFKSLASASPVGIVFFDAAGQCVDVNQRWCEMTGISSVDSLGDGWRDAIHPDDRNRVVGQWISSADGIDPDDYSEFRLCPQNGHTTWGVSQTSVIKDPDGIVTGYVRTLTDATRQKQTEQALRLLSTDLATLSGAPYNEAVVRYLSEMFDCEIAAICCGHPHRPGWNTTLAMVESGKIQPNIDYQIAGTPCDGISDRQSCIVPAQVQQRYPDDTFLVKKGLESYAAMRLIDSTGRQLGHLAIMSRRPLRDPAHVESLLQIFAMSVAAVMERRQIERRLSDLFEFSTDAIVLTNHEGTVVQANRQSEIVFGWNQSELIGQPVEFLMPEKFREGHVSLREQFLQMPVPRAMGENRSDLRGMRKDGTTFPVDVSLIPLETETGLVIAASIRDVSKIQQYLDELNSARIFADTVIESVSGLFYVFDEAGYLVRWNQSLQDLLGLTADEMRKTHALDVIHEDDRERIAGNLAEAMTRGQSEAEARILAKEPGARHFVLNGRRLDLNGTVYLVGSGADITDRQRAEQGIRELNHTLSQRVAERTAELTTANAELQKASQAKSEFLATMSHELRTPLNGILGMNELLLASALTDRQRQYAEASHISGKLLVQLINDILDLSKIEAGKLELDLGECDLETLVYDVADIMLHTAHHKGLSLNCRLSPDACVTGMVDHNRLQQVLVNLLGNALKFTSSGSVTILIDTVASQAEEGATRLRFSVIDTGIGIPSERLDRLFEPFSQVDSSTTRRYGGTGLGLSICRQLVELMGGSIGVESQVGSGSTFWFEIPVKVIDTRPRLERNRQLVAGTRVLAIDGPNGSRRQISESLESWGCPFEQVPGMSEAMERIPHAHPPFTIILADCHAVKEHEFVLLEQLITTHQLHAIGLGTPPENITLQYLYSLGVRHVLSDPIRPSTLFNAVCSVLSLSGGAALHLEGQLPGIVDATVPISGHVLVAEDNRINQLYIVEMLKLLGCTCDVVADGAEVLVAVNQNQYDLVLMDCQMPEVDGFAASREIRQREATGQLPGRLPIVALTANALKGDREQCLAAGMDEYLTKPVDRAQLKKVLSRFLSELPPPKEE